MELEQLTAEIERLSVTQRLLLTQDIWDSIARESGILPLPEWQKEELARRYHLYQQGDMDLHDWREVHAQLRSKE